MRSRSFTRLAAAFLAGGLALAGAVPASAEPGPAALPDPGAAAVDWLEGELAADSGLLTTSYEYEGTTYTVPDWGLTLDAVLALAAAGLRGEAPATTAIGLVEDNVDSYISGVDFGAPDDRYAGPIAKALFAGSVQGLDTTDFGGVDLQAELLALLQDDGPDVGRFSDVGFADYSNGFGQAFAIMALAQYDKLPASAVGFLLDQQCPSGGFRGNYATSGGCTDDAEATVDATAMAIQALVTASSECAERDAVAAAVAWLVDGQNDAGAFGGESGSNANSSGLAAVILRSLGQDESADAAAGFIGGLQLEAGDDLGAVALNAAGFASAGDGVQLLERDGFRRATTQGALAFDLLSYTELHGGPIDPAAFAPCPSTPPAPTTPTLRLSASTVVAGASLTATGEGFPAGETVHGVLHSTPVDLGTAVVDESGTVVLAFTVPADLEAGPHTVTVTSDSGATASATVEVTAVESPRVLPATGARTGPEAALGAGLVVTGGALLVAARRRRSVVAGR